jgi:hypothetical protein
MPTTTKLNFKVEGKIMKVMEVEDVYGINMTWNMEKLRKINKTYA